MKSRFSKRFSGWLSSGWAVILILPAASFAGVPGVQAIPVARDVSLSKALDFNVGACILGLLDPRVVAPCSVPHGHTYSQWATLWEAWFLHLTAQPDGVVPTRIAASTNPATFGFWLAASPRIATFRPEKISFFLSLTRSALTWRRRRSSGPLLAIGSRAPNT